MHLVLRVLATAQAMGKAGQRIFKSYGLTVAQFNVLNLLSDQPEGIHASALAKALIVDPSNITGLLNRMKREGYLKELKNPNDGRQRVVTLSSSGRRLWERAHVKYQRVLEAFESKIAQGDRSITDKVLAYMVAESDSLQ
jgi:DNA-binding MarR family transcriptional regulator